MVANLNQFNDLRSITIAGIGLLGGSIGLAYRSIGGQAKRLGLGRRRSSIMKALQFGAIDTGTTIPRKALQNADMVFVATPIGHFEAVFRQLADHLPDGAVVTDVGSTKQVVMELAERVLPPRIHFVGSHPMAGSENAGVEFARADLFQRALCLIVPPQSADPVAIARVEDFWQRLGMRTLRITAQRHDQWVAQISHLPHVVASALVELASDEGSMDLAATGFQDTTRVASGLPSMWLDILMTNNRRLDQAIGELIRRLQTVRKQLRSGDAEGILDFLTRTKQARDRWIQHRYAEREIEP